MTNRPTHVLVAIDFSPASRRALRYGVDLARRNGARLDIVHVLSPRVPLAAGPEPVVVVATLTDERQRVIRQLEAWCEFARGRGTSCHAHLVDGDPVQGILDTAKRLEADHVVLGAHGHSRWHDLLVGSVARGVQGRARCPVTTLRALDGEEDEAEELEGHEAPYEL